ncbi:MAG: hypothetical protein AB1349_13165 [Elusimicrobiota bacterium]
MGGNRGKPSKRSKRSLVKRFSNKLLRSFRILLKDGFLSFANLVFVFANLVLGYFILRTAVVQFRETRKYQEWLRKEQSPSPDLSLEVTKIDTVPPDSVSIHFSLTNRGDTIAKEVQARFVMDTIDWKYKFDGVPVTQYDAGGLSGHEIEHL